MNCSKHPNEKMIQLATSWVCDVCDPPKSTVVPAPVAEEKAVPEAVPAGTYLTKEQLEVLVGCRLAVHSLYSLFDERLFPKNSRLVRDLVAALHDSLKVLDTGSSDADEEG